MNIGGRKSQRAAELRSVRNAARDGEWTTEHRRGMLEVAGRKRAAYGGRRGALVFDRDSAHRLDGERLRRGTQCRDVACAAPAEAKVLADQHPASVEPADQHVRDEFLGRKRCEPLIEARDNGSRNAEVAKALELASQ